MTILAKKFNRYLPKLGVILLLMSFGVLTGFSTLLHAHELDFNSAHDGCSACHWNQSNQADETDTPGIETASLFQSFQRVLAGGRNKPLLNKLFNRGPPTLS